MQDRPYQIELESDCYSAWNGGSQVVMPVLPTGGGKTVVVAKIIRKETERHNTAVIAHRGELVGQLSVATARAGVRHNIIGPPDLVKLCVAEQMRELGTNFYNPQARCTVVSVDTLGRNLERYEGWGRNVGMWVIDEGHHILRENKWGNVVTTLMPEARGMCPTATPCRADRKGLGRHADGLVDRLVLGPGQRDLINMKYLADYEIVCPESDIQLLRTDIGSTGDYSPAKLKKAARKSHIVGDVSTAYRKFAWGMRTIVFATDVETAGDIASDLRKIGVKAECISAETPALIRSQLIQQFRKGELTVLVNVDLFGEGFDVPAVECVIMARPTESFGLYCQQFGRALRIFAGKIRGLVIDMVGNVRRHGLPDIEREWTLDGGEKVPRTKRDEDMIPQRACLGCTRPYPRFLTQCPYCGMPVIPAGRAALEQVDGDLALLDINVLNAMRGAALKALESPEMVRSNMKIAGLSDIVAASGAKGRRERLQHVDTLRACMAWWAQAYADKGRSEREIDKLFYLTFGTDRYTALTLDSAKCDELATRVAGALARV